MKITQLNHTPQTDVHEDWFNAKPDAAADAATTWYGQVKDLPMIKAKLHGLPYDQLDDRGQGMVRDMHVATLARARNLDEDMVAMLKQAMANAAMDSHGSVKEAKYEIHHVDRDGRTKAVQHYGDDYSDETVRRDARYLQKNNPHATIKVYKDKKPLDFKDVKEGDNVEQMTDRQLRHTVDKLGHGEVSTPDAVKYQHAKSELERRGKMDEAAMGTSAWADYLRNMLDHWQHSALVQLERTYGRETVDRVIDNYAYMVTPPEQFNERAFVDPANKTVAEYIMRSLEGEMSAGRLGTINEGMSVRDLEAAIISRLMITNQLLPMLKQYGLDAVYDAIKTTAEDHHDTDELGTSDVSIMIKQVMGQLSLSALEEDDDFDDSIRNALTAGIKGDNAGAKTALQKAKQNRPNNIPMAPSNKPMTKISKQDSFAGHVQQAIDSKRKGDTTAMQAHLDQAEKIGVAGSAGSKDAQDLLSQLDESPVMGDVLMMELADGRLLAASIAEARGNAIVIELDETGSAWLEESPDHSALKIGKGDAAISRVANDWNQMVDALQHDTPFGWADVFKAEANGEASLAHKMPYLWSRIWRQQHKKLGDDITHADEMQWIDDVSAAIGPAQYDEQVKPQSAMVRKRLDAKDPTMLAVWMNSTAGTRGMSVKSLAQKMAIKAGHPRDHYWKKISNMVSEADSMYKDWYIVSKRSPDAPVPGVSGFHSSEDAEQHLKTTMKDPSQYMVRNVSGKPAEEGMHQAMEAGMPSSVAKHKKDLNSKTPEELYSRFRSVADRQGGASPDRIEKLAREMAWRHGYGKMSDHYWKQFKHLITDDVSEAKYHGKEVKLGKPIRTNTSSGGKFKVYVRDPKTGNIKMVRFGDTTGLSIKRDDPKRRKSFRARHHCDNPGPRTKARYWSCRMWTRKPVGKILKGK